jgi:Fe2+ or Zn2+ uptake regulation protein
MKQLKNSKQRTIILEALRLNCNHPTADEIYKMIHNEHPNISLATVYRNLNLLTELGIIKKIPIASSSDRFDATMTEHYHVHCRKCGSVQDFFYEDFSASKAAIEAITDYEVIHQDLVFTGICPQCKNETKEQ